MTTVLLTTGTAGTTDKDVTIGDVVTVKLRAENGNPITETGVVAEILD